MKLQVGFLLFALQLTAAASDKRFKHLGALHKRQNTTPVTSATSSASGAPSSAPAGTTSIPTTIPTNIPTPTASGIPPLSQITSGMSSQATQPVTTTYKAGASPPVSGAPSLPTSFVFKASDWPLQDKIPDTNSPEVQEWLKELDGFDIPTFSPTADGSCAGDPAAAADSANRGWWTCGGHVRSTDITACPDKLTWGVSFDDGPSPYTQSVLNNKTLLNYLTQKDIHATFFVVGSRVIERPTVLLEQYMSGHEISVHTWSHKPLTSLTTEQIVAELGWTRKAIRQILGVTPTTMRPPFGDIDDRVRAISLAMGMVPIIWTRTPGGGVFDTNDWRVAAGQVTGLQSYATFQTILSNATSIDTGFIVLQHDLFAITVDLAIGYTLDAALNHNPKFNLKPIGQCMKLPTSDLYLESTTNKTFPYTNHTVDINGDGKPESPGSGNAGFTNAIPTFSVLYLGGLAALFSLL
ncbi:carbohydrate esterase family 4 protein [Amanita thiersii Skay4041]|uniref:chitin deacetylase n=1 Tax=Amanita thiersii Skay4041 TaxID=703135 RepID=A0A2A9NU73_9AGAR|nr:carbohydrate esterase family 4 protein [Amanita thiersii Skay4041]